jgi:hypothetical protein
MMNIRQAVNTIQSRLAPSTRLAQAIPLKVWLAAAALLVAGLWLHEHDARVRAAAELRQEKQRAEQQVSQLRAQSEAAVRDANVRNARTMAVLEAQRRNLEQKADALTHQLQALRQQQQVRDREIASLPASALRVRLEQQLGAGALAENAPGMAPPEPGKNGTAPKAGAELALTEAGARRVATALADRDACLEQSALQDRQAGNCREQLSARAAEIQTQADSLAKLNQALSAKDGILADREREFKAELDAARGTFRSRLARALKFLAAGAAIGAAIR